MRDVTSSDERRLARKIICLQQKIISNLKKISPRCLLSHRFSIQPVAPTSMIRHFRQSSRIVFSKLYPPDLLEFRYFGTTRADVKLSSYICSIPRYAKLPVVKIFCIVEADKRGVSRNKKWGSSNRHGFY